MKRAYLLLSFSALVTLGGCEHIVHSDTKLSQSKIELHQDTVFHEMSVGEFNAQNVAFGYLQSGAATLDVGVSYDPDSDGAALRASRVLSRIVGDLESYGASNVQSVIVPAKGQRGMKILVSYDGFEAAAPSDCDLMPGLAHNNIEPEKDYQIGCSVNSLIARQVARPADLAGGAEVDYSVNDGRRATNITEPNRAGVRNPPLEGERASE